MARLSDLARDSRATPNENDRYDDDGLLVCGRCGKHRECVIPMYGRKVIRPIVCDCLPRRFNNKNNVLTVKPGTFYKGVSRETKDLES